ncbi:3-demethylubiquinone-9 3-methyltransferase [Aspergillus melleus]|uniref:3-demethylubiquinone-9 3-methyltransferase n=1 Tax=Aspergillus melleus TaxID=138277 RepID=UPI001E8E436B|nr:Hexaprenyldihydroxybenzoate methyltransferase, mitochondrial [Aspergillus melleus]KAH8428250.1 Hexaprenyldihydroxybenzoate methyltransferase, mitochondrial [Aspergillus melleus]
MALRPTLTKRLPSLSTLSLRTHSTSVSANEVTHFSALASSWWDPMGSSRVLHLMNPLRHDFIASCLADGLPAPSYSSPSSSSPNNLRYLDVGCGGGIFAESLARTIPSSSSSSSQTQPTSPEASASTATPTRAASITAIDPTPQLIQIARDHARTDPKVAAHLSSGKFQYRNCTLEDLVRAYQQAQTSSPSPHSQPQPQPQPQNQFDIVTLFEVLEHIDTNATSSPLRFLTDCLRLLRPGGWLIGSTISRSLPAFLVNQVIAEAPWPIGVVPRGTHDWAKFVNPEELRGWAREGLLASTSSTGPTSSGSGSGSGSGSAATATTTQNINSRSATMQWKCSGVMYFPGIGWKIVSGSENWGNYFWAVRKGL